MVGWAKSPARTTKLAQGSCAILATRSNLRPDRVGIAPPPRCKRHRLAGAMPTLQSDGSSDFNPTLLAGGDYPPFGCSLARLFRTATVLGCSGPSAFSQIAS